MVRAAGPDGDWRQRFLARHRLPVSYVDEAARWFEPLADRLASRCAGGESALLAGVNGSQGSGKSTFCDYLREYLHHTRGLTVITLSLDDFYHTRERRGELAAQVHPLLATRGVPGTHDIALLERVLDALADACPGDIVDIPRFDKARDDRRPASDWDRHTGPVDLVLLEGWCLGALPQSAAALSRPVNALEREKDPDATWRRYVNGVLRTRFRPLYRRIGCWIMLRAPSFDCVLEWRWEQERKLAQAGATGDRVMDKAQVAHFISFYQRLTEHCLQTLPQQVDFLLQLDERRRVVACRGPERRT